MSATENNINGNHVTDTEAFDLAELFVRNSAPQSADSKLAPQNIVANSPTATEERLGIAPNLTRSLLESKWANTPGNSATPTPTPTPPASPLWVEGTYTNADGKTVKDGDPVSFNDVAQGGYGDCYFMASLAAIARSHPETIRNMITENHDAQGKTTSYTVTFHEKDTGWFGTGLFASGGYNDTKVTVTVAEVAQDATVGAHPGDSGEVWTEVLETAFAKYRGGADNITNGGWPHEWLPLLTGRDSQRYEYNGAAGSGISFSKLQSEVAAGKPVVIDTRESVDATHPYDLVGPHVYMVKRVYTEKVYDENTGHAHNVQYVELYNPWGSSHPKPIPFSELSKYFTDVAVG